MRAGSSRAHTKTLKGSILPKAILVRPDCGQGLYIYRIIEWTHHLREMRNYLGDEIECMSFLYVEQPHTLNQRIASLKPPSPALQSGTCSVGTRPLFISSCAPQMRPPPKGLAAHPLRIFMNHSPPGTRGPVAWMQRPRDALPCNPRKHNRANLGDNAEPAPRPICSEHNERAQEWHPDPARQAHELT